MSTAAPRIAVIGGGLSGLAAAHRLIELADESKRPLDLTLFEAGPRLGGLIRTERIGEYLVERGADSFITNKPWAVDLCRRLGLEQRLIPTDPRYRGALVLRNGKPVPVPEGFTLISPARLGPVIASPIFSLRGKLRLALECCIPPRRSEEDESLASFVRRRFGREALDRLVQPLVGGIYTSDPEQLSLQATMPRFLEMERRHGSLIRAARRSSDGDPADQRATGARYGLFTAPAGGMSELLDALVARVSQRAAVRLNTVINGLQTGSETGCTLTLADGTPERFDSVILAVPAWRAAELLEGTDDELAGLLKRIEYASSAIVLTGHRLADIDHPLDAFGLVVPAIENRRILAVSFASRKFADRAPEGRVLLRTFIGGAMQPELLNHTDQELVAIVREELTAIFGLRGHEEFAEVARYPRSMPQYHVGHLDIVAKIEARLAKHPALELAGNALHGVGIPDTIHSGEQAAKRAMSEVNCGKC